MMMLQNHRAYVNICNFIQFFMVTDWQNRIFTYYELFTYSQYSLKWQDTGVQYYRFYTVVDKKGLLLLGYFLIHKANLV